MHRYIPWMVVALMGCDPTAAPTAELLPIPGQPLAIPPTLQVVAPDTTMAGAQFDVEIRGGPALRPGRVLLSDGTIALGGGYCIPRGGDCVDITFGTRQGALSFRFDAVGEAVRVVDVPADLAAGTYVGQVVGWDQAAQGYVVSAAFEIEVTGTPGGDSAHTDADSATDPVDTDPVDTDISRSCYGDASLCDLRLDEMTVLGTRHSASSTAYGVPRTRSVQTQTLATQLDAGVRAVHWVLSTCEAVDTEPCICSPAFLGDLSSCAVPLSGVLGELATWLAAHPTEVVAVHQDVWSPPSSWADVERAYGDAGLAPLRADAAEVATSTWGELLDADHRLVVYGPGDGTDPSLALFLPFSDLFFTASDNSAASDWTCLDELGQEADLGRRVVVQHRWSGRFEEPDADISACANTEAESLEHAVACTGSAAGVQVFAVDHLASGPGPFEVVNALNGVEHLPVPYADQCTEPPLGCDDANPCATGVCAPEGFCTDCIADADCPGHCDERSGTCQTSFIIDLPCIRDLECESRVCLGEVCTECTVDEDCPAGNRCDANGFCESLPGLGDACLVDDECATGICEGDVCAECRETPVAEGCVEGLQTCEANACIAKSTFGGSCSVDEDCISGSCIDNTCTLGACQQESDCALPRPLLGGGPEALLAAGRAGLIEFPNGVPTLEDGLLVFPPHRSNAILIRMDLPDGWFDSGSERLDYTIDADGVPFWGISDGDTFVTVSVVDGTLRMSDQDDNRTHVADEDYAATVPFSDSSPWTIEHALVNRVREELTIQGASGGSTQQIRATGIRDGRSYSFVFGARGDAGVRLGDLTIGQAGLTCNEASGECVPKREVGEFCVDLGDDGCLSGNCTITCIGCTIFDGCDFDSQYCEEGVCRNKAGPGGGCHGDIECLSNLCELEYDEPCPTGTSASTFCSEQGVATTSCAECTTDAHCAEDQFCSEGEKRCYDDLLNDATCTRDSMCASDLCDGFACADCSNFYLPVGGPVGCDFDEQFCELGSCIDKRGTGEFCGFADQCVSDICTIQQRCGDCTTHNDCSDTEFCDQQICTPRRENGEGCGSSDIQCLSGVCDTNTCVECVALPVPDGCDFDDEYCEAQTCHPKGETGDDCVFADQCVSDICNILTGTCGDCDDHGDCGATEFCDGATSQCTPQREAGGACLADDAVCVSGICDTTICVECTALPQDGCDFATQFCEFGACEDKGGLGDSCGLGDQCTSGICNLPTQQCGNCDSDDDCSGSQWCDLGRSTCTNPLPNGSACLNNDDACDSGICDGAICVECTALPQEGCDFGSEFCEFGSCESRGGVGESCLLGDQCASGICNLLSMSCGECDAHGDCDSDDRCDFTTSLCIPDAGFGGACLADEECSTGICNVTFTCVDCENSNDCGSWSNCSIGGTCDPFGQRGDFCVFDSDCQSGSCNPNAVLNPFDATCD